LLSYLQTPSFNLNSYALPPIAPKNGFQIVPLDASIGRAEIDGIGAASLWTVYRYDGNAFLPSAVQANDSLGSYDFNGYDSSRPYLGARIEADATENYLTSASSATVNAGGTGGTPGACTVSLSGGTFSSVGKFSGTVSAGGVLTGALTLNQAGSYSAAPYSTLPLVTGVSTAVPVTGCGLSGTTLNVTFVTLNGGTKLRFFRTISGGTALNPFLTTDSSGGVEICDSTGSCGTAPGDGGIGVKGTIYAPAYVSGSTAGVTCSGSPTVNFASTNGIVTHC
jgi:hypothetical protein